jgi:hypothetical protein
LQEPERWPEQEQVEVHEHVEVHEEPRPRAHFDVVGREPSGFREERRRAWQERLEDRRARRFTLAGLVTFGLAIVAASWLLAGGLRGEPPTGLLAPDEVLAVGMVAVVLGAVVAWSAGEGHVLGLGLSWFLGLVALLVAVRQYLLQWDVSATGQALVVALGLLGLATVAVDSVALASWRGRRLQSRIFGGGRSGKPGGRPG